MSDDLDALEPGDCECGHSYDSHSDRGCDSEILVPLANEWEDCPCSMYAEAERSDTYQTVFDMELDGDQG